MPTSAGKKKQGGLRGPSGEGSAQKMANKDTTGGGRKNTSAWGLHAERQPAPGRKKKGWWTANIKKKGSRKITLRGGVHECTDVEQNKLKLERGRRGEGGGTTRNGTQKKRDIANASMKGGGGGTWGKAKISGPKVQNAGAGTHGGGTDCAEKKSRRSPQKDQREHPHAKSTRGETRLRENKQPKRER